MSPNESSTPNANPHHEFEATLRERLTEWQERLEKIRGDRRRQSAPLEQDFEDQATQRQNDETLDALDARGRQEIEAIRAALGRIASGAFGSCVGCGEAIPTARLRAQPAAIDCLACAREDGAVS
jgi:RNA polymerase-binding transcription factor DksA